MAGLAGWLETGRRGYGHEAQVFGVQAWQMARQRGHGGGVQRAHHHGHPWRAGHTSEGGAPPGRHSQGLAAAACHRGFGLGADRVRVGWGGPHYVLHFVDSAAWGDVSHWVEVAVACHRFFIPRTMVPRSSSSRWAT